MNCATSCITVAVEGGMTVLQTRRLFAFELSPGALELVLNIHWKVFDEMEIEK